MHHQNCHHVLLARSGVGHVTVCEGCGQIHLGLQFMTLRLDPEAFRALAEMVGRAQAGLEQAAPHTTTLASVSPAGGLH